MYFRIFIKVVLVDRSVIEITHMDITLAAFCHHNELHHNELHHNELHPIIATFSPEDTSPKYWQIHV
jgi:hypothetical protein